MGLTKFPLYTEVTFTNPITKKIFVSKIYAADYTGADERTWQVQVKVADGCLVWKPLMDVTEVKE